MDGPQELLAAFIKHYYTHPNNPVIQPNTRGMRAFADYTWDQIAALKRRLYRISCERDILLDEDASRKDIEAELVRISEMSDEEVDQALAEGK